MKKNEAVIAHNISYEKKLRNSDRFRPYAARKARSLNPRNAGIDFD